MNHTWIASRVDEARLSRLAQLIALKIRAGDLLALSGDLGTGKSTFARALIRALLGEPDAEVPSPTFAILQAYDTPRAGVVHADLYRTRSNQEIDELGLADILNANALLVEWPERAASFKAGERLDIAFSETEDPNLRTVTLTGHGLWSARLARIETIMRFLDGLAFWNSARVGYLQGDASARAYARLDAGEKRAVLMDAPRQPDGPPIRGGLPYSRIAHLAEDVRPFAAIGRTLKSYGFSAPEILAEDLDAGLLLIEDLGDRVFGREAANGASMRMLWQAATETLAAIRHIPVPDSIALADGTVHVIPKLDHSVLAIETDLLVDWYWPALLKAPAPETARQDFARLWSDAFAKVLAGPQGWVLRDYHSPNLLWLPDRNGAAQTGIIDFQDALAGSPAYDLVSVLQDARLDVPQDIEHDMFEHYCALAAKAEPGFDRHGFAFAYAALGAQRNTKILGIFARLARRDGKPGYLAHIPRIWRYLERDLAHPGLEALRHWYDHHLPPAQRARVLDA